MAQADPDVERAMEGIHEDPAGAAGLQLIDAKDVLNRPYEPPMFAVRYIVPQIGVVLATGDTGAGKTAFLLHLCLCVLFGLPVGGRFVIQNVVGPLLYFNGEMAPDALRGYLYQALEGIGRSVGHLPAGRLMFEGQSGYSSATLAQDSTARFEFETLLDRVRPSIVILDTLRGLTQLDENDTQAVRELLNWLGGLAVRYGCCFVVAHHLRKLGAISNSDRERVAGSRDLIAAVDVHLAFKSTDGRPMHGLTIGKTRSPADGVAQGTHWAVDARLDMTTSPPRSTFTIAEPENVSLTASIDDDEDEILALIDAEGPQTLEQLGARTGNRKRAYERLLRAGTVVKRGSVQRKSLIGRPEQYDRNEFSFDPAPDPTSEKRDNHAGLSGVNGRPRSRPRSSPEPVGVTAIPRAETTTELADPAGNGEWGQGSDTISDPDPDPVRENTTLPGRADVDADGFTRRSMLCTGCKRAVRVRPESRRCRDCGTKAAAT